MPTEKQKRAVAKRGRSGLPDAARPERTYKRGPRKQFPWDLRVGFTPDQEQWLGEVAEDQGVSMGDVVRAAVDRMRNAGTWPNVRKAKG